MTRRQLAVDGTKAGFDRIRLLDQATDYGVAWGPEFTAPFRVVWRDNQPQIFLGHTFVAAMETQLGQLWIRDAYPAEFDAPLVRALRNAVTCADRIGKMIRAEKVQAKDDVADTGLLTKEVTRFPLEIQNTKDLREALLGLPLVSSKMSGTLSHTRVNRQICRSVVLRVRRGNTRHTFRIGDDNSVGADEYLTYGLHKSRIDALLAEGLAAFRARHDVARWSDDLHRLSNLPAIDNESVFEDFKHVNKKDPLPTYAYGCVRGSSHDFNMHATVNGVPVGQHSLTQAFEFETHPLFLDEHLPPANLISTGMGAFFMRFKINAMGRVADDYPALSRDLIAQRVQDTDFGYDP